MPVILAGIGWHMVGAASAASFYAPIGKVKKWSWETTWAVAGFFSWILLPISVSFLLLPDFHAFYASIDTHVLLKVALFGAMWGVGNVSYGLTMRHLGISLGVGVAIGVTLMVGTLMPPILHGQAAILFTTKGGLFTMAGVLVALMGVAVVSYAGHQKEIQLSGELREFNLKLGLILAVLCGVFSSGMAFAIDAAEPMKAAALQLGVNPLYAALPSYVFIMGGGAVVNLSYCFIRLAALKRLSLRSDLSHPRGTLLKNASLAAMGGIMWYLQFFFYAWG
jgi:L-rhamnose-H+ transport protein